MTMMNPLTTQLQSTLSQAGNVKLPVANPTPSVNGKPQQAVTLQLNQLAQVQQTIQAQGLRTGVAGLLSLLATLQAQFPHAMPELLTSLQNRLQPYLLGSRQLSDATKVRQQVLQSGLFMEGNMANGEALETVLNDLKTQLFQILTLMNPNRQLMLQGGLPVFMDRMPSAARSLLTSENSHGLGGKGGKTVAGKQLQSYLQHSGEEHLGISDEVVNNWLAQQVEESLQQLVRNQLRCQQNGDDTHWQLELLVQLETNADLQSMPLQITEHTIGDNAEAETANWSLRFTLQLPRLGKVGIRLQLTGRSVEVVYECAETAGAAARFRQQQQLHAALAAKGLYLAGFVHKTNAESTE